MGCHWIILLLLGCGFECAKPKIKTVEVHFPFSEFQLLPYEADGWKQKPTMARYMIFPKGETLMELCGRHQYKFMGPIPLGELHLFFHIEIPKYYRSCLQFMNPLKKRILEMKTHRVKIRGKEVEIILNLRSPKLMVRNVLNGYCGRIALLDKTHVRIVAEWADTHKVVSIPRDVQFKTSLEKLKPFLFGWYTYAYEQQYASSQFFERQYVDIGKGIKHERIIVQPNTRYHIMDNIQGYPIDALLSVDLVFESNIISNAEMRIKHSIDSCIQFERSIKFIEGKSQLVLMTMSETSSSRQLRGRYQVVIGWPITKNAVEREELSFYLMNDDENGTLCENIEFLWEVSSRLVHSKIPVRFEPLLELLHTNPMNYLDEDMNLLAIDDSRTNRTSRKFSSQPPEED